MGVSGEASLVPNKKKRSNSSDNLATKLELNAETGQIPKICMKFKGRLSFVKLAPNPPLEKKFKRRKKSSLIIFLPVRKIGHVVKGKKLIMKIVSLGSEKA